MPVTVTVCPTLSRADRKTVALRHGHSLGDMIAATGLPPAELEIRIDGEDVRAGEVERVPGEGAVVVIARRPAGFLPPLWAAIAHVTGTLSFSEQFRIGTFTVGGEILRRYHASLVQPPFEQEGGLARRRTISGSRNALRRYESVRRVLGRMRVKPDLAAQTYTVVKGGKLYQYSLLTFGPGPLSISDIRIAKDPIMKPASAVSLTAVNTADAGSLRGELRFELRAGYTADSPLTLYAQDVQEVLVDQELRHGAGWLERRTEPGTTKIDVNIGFYSGLFWQRDDGKLKERTVRIDVGYRRLGAATWTDGGTIVCGPEKNRSSRYYAKTFSNLTADTYEVRLRRITEQGQVDDPGIQDTSHWATMLCFRSGTGYPVKRTGLALLAVEIQITGAFSSLVDNISADCTTIAKDWDSGSGTWIERATTNPASLYRLVLQDHVNREAVADSEIDLAALAAWHADGWSFGREVAGETVRDVLGMLCAAGRASPDMIDGKHTVVRETALGAATFHFSPATVVRGSFRGALTYETLPHALRVTWTDPASDWLETERLVYDDGYTASNATRYEKLEIPGVIDADTAHKLGRFHLAQGRLRGETFEVRSLEALRNVRGDNGRLVYDAPLLGLAAGRVTGVTLNGGGACTEITVDEACTMSGGGSYAVLVRRTANGNEIVSAVTTAAGSQTTLTFSSPIASGSPHPAVGDLFMFGEAGQVAADVKILELEPLDDGAFRVLMTHAAPAVLDADTGAIPRWDPKISIPPGDEALATPPPRVLSVRAASNTSGTAGTTAARITIAPQGVAAQR